MKVEKTVTIAAVPERKQVETDHYLCDICGARIKWPGSYEVKEIGFELQLSVHRFRVKLGYKTGASYPEGGNSREEEFDVCPECWTNRVVPWMQSHQGVSPRVTECDW